MSLSQEGNSHCIGNKTLFIITLHVVAIIASILDIIPPVSDNLHRVAFVAIIRCGLMQGLGGIYGGRCRGNSGRTT
jgi:hypothetical protein